MPVISSLLRTQHLKVFLATLRLPSLTYLLESHHLCHHLFYHLSNPSARSGDPALLLDPDIRHAQNMSVLHLFT